MDVITVLVVAILINKSGSQILSLSPTTCFSSGDTLTLNCKTSDVSLGITFYQDGTSKGGCVPSVPVICGVGLTQSGTTTTTSLVISSFNDATNSGNWTCEYGATPSPVMFIAVNPCVETTAGSIEGRLSKAIYTKTDEAVSVGVGSEAAVSILISVVISACACACACACTCITLVFFPQKYVLFGREVFGIQIILVAAITQVSTVIIAAIVLSVYADQYDKSVTMSAILSLLCVFPGLGVVIYLVIVVFCVRGEYSPVITESCTPSGKTVLLILIVILPFAWFVLLLMIFINCTDKNKDEGNGKPDNNKDEEKGKSDKHKHEEHGTPDKNKNAEKGKPDTNKDEGNGKPDKNEDKGKEKPDVKDVKESGNQEQG